jgi:hypothetical protein
MGLFPLAFAFLGGLVGVAGGSALDFISGAWTARSDEAQRILNAADEEADEGTDMENLCPEIAEALLQGARDRASLDDVWRELDRVLGDLPPEEAERSMNLLPHEFLVELRRDHPRGENEHGEPKG